MRLSGSSARLSPRNLALVGAVRSRHGLDVTPEQLERWRGWRGVGLIPRRPSGTRARWRPGLAATIPADEVAQVAAAAELAPRLPRSLDALALGLAARGYRLDPSAVRAALLARFDRAAGRRWRLDELHQAWRAAGLPLRDPQVTAGDGRPSRRAVRDHVERVGLGREEPVAPELLAEDVLTVEEARRRLEQATPAGIAYALELGRLRASDEPQAASFATWYLVYGPGQPDPPAESAPMWRVGTY